MLRNQGVIKANMVAQGDVIPYINGGISSYFVTFIGLQMNKDKEREQNSWTVKHLHIHLN